MNFPLSRTLGVVAGEELARRTAGQPAVAVLVGGAGSGKTRLFNHLEVCAGTLGIEGRAISVNLRHAEPTKELLRHLIASLPASPGRPHLALGTTALIQRAASMLRTRAATLLLFDHADSLGADGTRLLLEVLDELNAKGQPAGAILAVRAANRPLREALLESGWGEGIHVLLAFTPSELVSTLCRWRPLLHPVLGAYRKDDQAAPLTKLVRRLHHATGGRPRALERFVRAFDLAYADKAEVSLLGLQEMFAAYRARLERELAGDPVSAPQLDGELVQNELQLVGR